MIGWCGGELAVELVDILLSGLAVHASFCAASPGEGAVIGVGFMCRNVVGFESQEHCSAMAGLTASRQLGANCAHSRARRVMTPRA